LLVGFVVRFALETTHVSPEARALLAVGFCGGFTTFSTFAWEVLSLGEQGAWARSALYLALSVSLSLMACVAGMAAARETAVALQR
jgi:CrcB protein